MKEAATTERYFTGSGANQRTTTQATVTMTGSWRT
jgi:hypothetical protein